MKLAYAMSELACGREWAKVLLVGGRGQARGLARCGKQVSTADCLSLSLQVPSLCSAAAELYVEILTQMHIEKTMKDDRIKDHGWWEEYFSVEGGWERNGGSSQSRIFAEHFTQRIKLDPTTAFSILDAGCALGDALKHFAKVYPHAALHGIDFSTTAITRCKHEIGERATLSAGDLEEIDAHYDIIYCSNTLEHFSDFEIKARYLTQHCDRLCILVPFNEMECGKPLTPSPDRHHQHTFLRHSFDFLIRESLASSIKTHVFSCPGAWGWTYSKRIGQAFRNIERVLRNRPWIYPPRQILFDIRTTRQG